MGCAVEKVVITPTGMRPGYTCYMEVLINIIVVHNLVDLWSMYNSDQLLSVNFVAY